MEILKMIAGGIGGVAAGIIGCIILMKVAEWVFPNPD